MPMRPSSVEVNFNGLVGPTHHYGGLSFGNIASTEHRHKVSNPKAACLQGLQKMRLLHTLGILQGILPPHLRPNIAMLQRLGFSGAKDIDILEKAYAYAPDLVATAYSSSAMWTANAATISPSCDTADRKVHITPANLLTEFHRSLEPPFTAHLLKSLFHDKKHFVHHDPLPSHPLFADEGAANHIRLAPSHGTHGIEIFVYGRTHKSSNTHGPQKFPARQTQEAAKAIQRLHSLDARHTLLLQQNKEAIDEGVFHNDVISVGNTTFLLAHEDAFQDPSALATLQESCRQLGFTPSCHIVRRRDMSVKEAVASYLFNSEILTLPDNTMVLIAPAECQETKSAKSILQHLVEDPTTPITAVHYVDLKESMHNGGGPACLRLRCPLTQEELATVHTPTLFSDTLYESLVAWVHRHYRDRLHLKDLLDPLLIQESKEALQDLAAILHLPTLYTP